MDDLEYSVAIEPARREPPEAAGSRHVLGDEMFLALMNCAMLSSKGRGEMLRSVCAAFHMILSPAALKQSGFTA